MDDLGVPLFLETSISIFGKVSNSKVEPQNQGLFFGPFSTGEATNSPPSVGPHDLGQIDENVRNPMQ